MSRKKPKITINITFDPELHTKSKRVAAELGLSLSVFIDQLVRRELERRKAGEGASP